MKEANERKTGELLEDLGDDCGGVYCKTYWHGRWLGVGEREIATLIEHLLARQYAKPFYMRYAI